MTNKYYSYLFIQLELSALKYILPVIKLAKPSLWGGHGPKTGRSAKQLFRYSKTIFPLITDEFPETFRPT
jgi:hypothetical protein